MADDLGFGDLGCQGHPDLHTPHLDALADGGVRMTRFHAAAPVCSPTRASCLTGRHPYRAGIRGANNGQLDAHEFTLQKLLKDHGYATGHFGKWHLGTMTKTVRDSNRGGPRGVAHFAPPWLRGFEVCFSTEAKVPTFDPMIKPGTNRPYGTHYWNERAEIVHDNLDGDDSRIIMDRVLPFVQGCAKAEQPFFAVVWLHAPHLPVVASEADRLRYKEFDKTTQNYYGCITALDREVGRLHDLLNKLEIADDTILWFCSDNGPEGQHGRAPGSAGNLRGRKRSLYEGGTRVPAILSWPAQLPKSLVVDTLSCTSDFLPTIARWLDFEIPDGLTLDGRELVTVFEAANRGTTVTRQKPIGFESAKRATWTDDRFKLVAKLSKQPREFPSIESIELFELQVDPSEATDLRDQHPDAAARMKAALTVWRQGLRARGK